MIVLPYSDTFTITEPELLFFLLVLSTNLNLNDVQGLLKFYPDKELFWSFQFSSEVMGFMDLVLEADRPGLKPWVHVSLAV